MTGTIARLALPAHVERQLETFVDAATNALGGDLDAIVLFGSAAEGRLRATSDVNVILVLRTFDAAKVDALREPLRVAHGAIRLAPMFLLVDEIDAAFEAFAVKYADIVRRHVVLHGEDPFARVDVSRAAVVARLRQVLLNLTMRLRQTYALRSLREEQLAFAVADAAGPLRASAATLLELEGEAPLAPKEALLRAASKVGGDRYAAALDELSRARETRELPPGVGARVLLELVDLAHHMRLRAAELAER